LNPQVWILAAGRLLSQIGTGFTLFYAPIFFVNQVHLSATLVGIGLGSGQISGVIGRILGGSWSDAQRWGRKRTLLWSALISAVASLVLAAAHNFPVFVLGNLLMGLGVGLYWPATEAVVADLTPAHQRHEAYAITRLADSLGLGLGVVCGGWLIGATGAYRALFVIDGISFLVFFAIIYAAIAETLDLPSVKQTTFQGWKQALSDRRLRVFVWVNILFTIYISQTHSTLPLYFSNFVRVSSDTTGFSATTISALFTGSLVLSIVCQLPVVRVLQRLTHPQALSLSALLWAGGFTLIWLSGVASMVPLIWASLGLAVTAIATVTYTPSASVLVADLAPDSLRGIYLSINSLCWAAGYLIGPPLGGFALDLPRPWADGLWLILAASVAIAIGILQSLNHLLQRP
jgi:MFS family permease